MNGTGPATPADDGLARFAPVRVCEVELSEPLPAITADGAGYGSAWVLARWYSEPLAQVDVSLADGDVSPERLAGLLWPAVAGPVAERLAAVGETAPAALPATGIQSAAPVPFLLGRDKVQANAPSATVIVCTRYRPERLAGCLDALLTQDYPGYEVIVVDNAPDNDAVERLVATLHGPVPVRYVAEPRPGLSWARNAGLAAARGVVVAYLDDDEQPDRYWLAEMVRGFSAAPDVAGVSGTVFPAKLDTPAQCLFERFGGHGKGRGFTAAVFDQASHARQHPLYPLPPFGVGASMAFDRDVLVAIGGFDVSLGAGTAAKAGEDTAVISLLMLTGATFVYWPAAVMWHEHRATLPELDVQLNGYGSGLTAFYTSLLLRHPRHLGSLLALAPRALRDLRGHGPESSETTGGGFPASLRRSELLGLAAGPFRYFRALTRNWQRRTS